MRELFPGYYPYDRESVSAFINKATVVLGASVLLDLYRISNNDLFLDILEDTKVTERLFMPYDTAWLYHHKLHSVIDEQMNSVNSASVALSSLKRVLENPFGHPYIKGDLVASFNKLVDELKTSLESDKKYLFAQLSTSDLKNRISKMLSGHVGAKYDDEMYRQLYDESKKRFQLQQPPCISMSSSKDDRAYHNRYIVWKQIIKYAKEKRQPVVLVLNRITPNWFFIYNETFITTHHDLINEFKRDTEQDLIILSAYDFIKAITNGNKDTNIQPLLNQLHSAPTMGNNQKINTGNTSNI